MADPKFVESLLLTEKMTFLLEKIYEGISDRLVNPPKKMIFIFCDDHDFIKEKPTNDAIYCVGSKILNTYRNPLSYEFLTARHLIEYLLKNYSNEKYPTAKRTTYDLLQKIGYQRKTMKSAFFMTLEDMQKWREETHTIHPDEYEKRERQKTLEAEIKLPLVQSLKKKLLDNLDHIPKMKKIWEDLKESGWEIIISDGVYSTGSIKNITSGVLYRLKIIEIHPSELLFRKSVFLTLFHEMFHAVRREKDRKGRQPDEYNEIDFFYTETIIVESEDEAYAFEALHSVRSIFPEEYIAELLLFWRSDVPLSISMYDYELINENPFEWAKKIWFLGQRYSSYRGNFLPGDENLLPDWENKLREKMFSLDDEMAYNSTLLHIIMRDYDKYIEEDPKKD
ncbi:MAG: hypothetical protein LBU87_04475 [Lactobacillales bacterium]|jgi:hypothetical protein|nr:hypothetical protein [Lactobacillales bacterium]